MRSATIPHPAAVIHRQSSAPRRLCPFCLPQNQPQLRAPPRLRTTPSPPRQCNRQRALFHRGCTARRNPPPPALSSSPISSGTLARHGDCWATRGWGGMFCSKCGNQLRPGARFRPACGSPVDAKRGGFSGPSGRASQASHKTQTSGAGASRGTNTFQDSDRSGNPHTGTAAPSPPPSRMPGCSRSPAERSPATR